MSSKFYYILLDNIKTLIYALILAVIIRSLFFQPFYIPSSSMEPTLLIGDRLFVSKYSYGYSKHSFPFSPEITEKRYFMKSPKRGDVVVFKTPADNRTDYIKRLIGLPGDTIQFINGDLYLNNKKIFRQKAELNNKVYCGNEKMNVIAYDETLPGGKKYLAVYRKKGTQLDTDKYEVPTDHYFFLGDNRDCSKDSRYMTSVGYVKSINLVGKANLLFFSSDKEKGNIFKFWKWHDYFRFERFFSEIK